MKAKNDGTIRHKGKNYKAVIQSRGANGRFAKSDAEFQEDESLIGKKSTPNAWD